MDQAPQEPQLPPPYIAPTAVASRWHRLPRPTPIGAVVGIGVLVICLLCLGGAATLLGTRRGTPTPTARPPTAGGPTVTPGVSPPAVGPGAPTPTEAALQPTAPTEPALQPTAPGEPATPTVPKPPTALPTPTLPASAPTPSALTFDLAELQYVAAFRGQLTRWTSTLTALNTALQRAASGDPAWVAQTRATANGVRALATEATTLQPPPRLDGIDMAYKAAATHYVQAMDWLAQWMDSPNPQTLSSLDAEMRQANDGLQEARRLLAAFLAH